MLVPTVSRSRNAFPFDESEVLERVVFVGEFDFNIGCEFVEEVALVHDIVGKDACVEH